MHAFLIFCVLAEAAAIVFQWIGVRSLAKYWSERQDKALAQILCEIPKLPGGMTETNWSEMCAKLYEHTDALATTAGCITAAQLAHADLVRQVAIGNDEKNVRLKALSDLSGIQAELMNVFDAKLSDLIEGCAKLDGDLSETSEDVRECVKLRQSDLAGLNERITEITDAQEKARRKSGSRTSPASYEGIRPAAEAGARKHPDPTHAELVALAQGPE